MAIATPFILIVKIREKRKTCFSFGETRLFISWRRSLPRRLFWIRASPLGCWLSYWILIYTRVLQKSKVMELGRREESGYIVERALRLTLDGKIGCNADGRLDLHVTFTEFVYTLSELLITCDWIHYHSADPLSTSEICPPTSIPHHIFTSNIILSPYCAAVSSWTPFGSVPRRRKLFTVRVLPRRVDLTASLSLSL